MASCRNLKFNVKLVVVEFCRNTDHILPGLSMNDDSKLMMNVFIYHLLKSCLRDSFNFMLSIYGDVCLLKLM